MARTRPSEELVAAPLPELIRDLGLAVADANKALGENESGIRFTIPEAEVEVHVSISVTNSTDISAGGSLNLHAFSVNASYKNAYSYSEEASSRIKILLRAVPADSAAPAATTVKKP